MYIPSFPCVYARIYTRMGKYNSLSYHYYYTENSYIREIEWKCFLLVTTKYLNRLLLYVVEKELRKARSEWTGTQEALSDAGWPTCGEIRGEKKYKRREGGLWEKQNNKPPPKKKKNTYKTSPFFYFY